MTIHTNKSVGTMTMVNLTGNELEVWVNSKRTSFLIPEMTHGKKPLKNKTLHR